MRRILKVFLWVMVWTGLSVQISIASAPVNEIQKNVLDNGLTVLIRDMPESPMVSVYMLTKTGAATEGEFLGSGVSHFLEHMFFKGTEKRSTSDIPKAIQSVGGSINASTGKDFTIFTITVPYEAFDVALDVLADMMMNAKIDENDFMKERDVILNEMRLHNDHPGRKLYEIANQVIYIRHPYKDPVIGYEDLFKQTTRDDLYRYYKSFYVPNNMILSIAGRIEDADILPKIEATFKDFSRGPTVVRNLPQEPAQISPRRYEETYPTDLSRMTISYPTVSLLDHDLYALDVLAKILGQGRSSRLYQDIYKEKKLVYSISASNYTPVDQGTFSVDALFDYPNVEEIIAGVDAQIRQIQSRGVSKEELDKAKRNVLSEYVFSNQTSSQTAYLQAIDEAFAGDYNFSREYVSSIKNVTSEQIQEVARHYLNPSAKSIIILKPEEEILPDEKVDKKLAADKAMSKIVFGNGLKVILKENHTYPLVSMRVTLNGGLLQEPEALNGIAQMTSQLWIKGTDKLSFQDIAKLTDLRGMYLSSYSGKYSFGIDIDFLSEDIDAAMDLMEDLIKNPAFRENEVEKIKQDTLAEIKSLDDSIFSFTSRKMNQLLFKEHPLRLDVQGTAESIIGIQSSDIRGFYQELACPNNMVISVFGDIDAKAVEKQLRKKFGSLVKQDIVLKSFTEKPLEASLEEQFILDKEQAMVMWGFHGIEIGDDDQYALDVLSSILGSSLSGRLFDAIREEFGDAYTLGMFSSPGKGAGSIRIYVLTNKDAVARVREIVTREIDQIKTEPVGDQELADVKSYLKGTFKSDIQTNSSLGFTSSLDELYGFGYDYYQKYDMLIDSVTVEDVQRVANAYLNLDRAVVVITHPGDLE